MKLSENFTLQEMTHSQTAVRRGLSNHPDPDSLANLEMLCTQVLEPIRRVAQAPIVVSSGYRSPEVNRLVGGAPSSQHTRGQAADILARGMSAAELYEVVKASQVKFDQLIEEFGEWVHVSWSPRPRAMCLKARMLDGKVAYLKDE